METIWKFLNGKKTAIGAVLDLAVLWISQKGWIDQNDLFFISGVLTIWTGFAIGHKIKKAKK